MEAAAIVRAAGLLKDRRDVMSVYARMTAGGGRPEISEFIVYRQHAAFRDRWSLDKLVDRHSHSMNSATIEGALVTALLKGIADQIDDLDRRLTELGVVLPTDRAAELEALAVEQGVSPPPPPPAPQPVILNP